MGARSRLTIQQIAIIGSVLIVLVVVGIFFGLIRPLQERKTAADAKFSSNQTNALRRPEVEDAKRKAQQEVAAAKREYARYEAKYMPKIDITNLLTGVQQRWDEQTNKLGPLTLRFLRADRSVRIAQQAIAVPAPPSDPNAVNTSAVVLPLGNVSVVGTFRNVLRHAERWNQFKRLVLVDNLTLAGNSPFLTAQYSLTCYIFTRGTAQGTIPTAGGDAGGFGGGGYPGGPGGEMPGGPPGGFAPPPDAGGAAVGPGGEPMGTPPQM